ncbi:MAG: hypothetical protein AAF908_09735, partial [Pseudomonadota bacterium]
MLPLTRPFDSARTAFTLLKMHPTEILLYVFPAWIVGDALAGFIFTDIPLPAKFAIFIAILMLGFLLAGILIYYLHRALLEGRRVLVSDLHRSRNRVWRVILRSLLLSIIAFAVGLPLAAVTIYLASTTDAGWLVAESAVQVIGGAAFFGSVLFFAIKIPHIVIHGAAPLPQSIREPQYLSSLARRLLEPVAVLLPWKIGY